MLARALLVISALAPAAAFGQTTLYSQPPWASPLGGIRRSTQLWIDPGPNGNDSDLDAILYENFTIDAGGTVTSVRWWGDAPPPLGFRIAFYPQDPNTVANQPDLFRPGAVGALQSHVYTSYASAIEGGTLYRYEATLATPFVAEPGTKYFVSVVARMTQPFQQWNWAQGIGGTSGTFWYQRADGGRYFNVGDNRALVLLGIAPPCLGDTNGDGVVNFTDLNAVLADFGISGAGLPGDANGDGIVDFADLNLVLSNFGDTCA
jgi:hypothetical protein